MPTTAASTGSVFSQRDQLVRDDLDTCFMFAPTVSFKVGPCNHGEFRRTNEVLGIWLSRRRGCLRSLTATRRTHVHANAQARQGISLTQLIFLSSDTRRIERNLRRHALARPSASHFFGCRYRNRLYKSRIQTTLQCANRIAR